MNRARYIQLTGDRLTSVAQLGRFFMNACGKSWFTSALGPKPRELEVVVVMRDTKTGQISIDATGLRSGEVVEAKYLKTAEILDFAVNTLNNATMGEHCGGEL